MIGAGMWRSVVKGLPGALCMSTKVSETMMKRTGTA
jgi:hypothetical protein